MIMYCLVLVAGLFAPAVDQPVWIEGESWFTQRGSSEPDRPPFASRGECLGSGWSGRRGHEVVFRFELSSSRPTTSLYLRYARQPAPAGRFDLLLDSKPVGRLELASTGGWGHREGRQWRFAAVSLGPLAAGWHTIRLVSLADKNNTNLDGFFLAGAQFTPPDRREQIEKFAMPRVVRGPDAPGPDCVAEDLSIEKFSGRLDDWYYPGEEAEERARLTVPKLAQIGAEHAVAGKNSNLKGRPVGDLPRVDGWRLVARLSQPQPMAVLEREFDRWGLIVYVGREGIVAEVRKAVGRLEKIARPQIRFPKDYFEQVLASREDVLGSKVLAGGHEATYGALAGYLSPLETYTFIGSPSQTQKFIVYPDGSLGTDPNATRSARKESLAFDAGAFSAKLDTAAAKRGLLGGWLGAIDYGFFDAATRLGYEIMALPNAKAPQAVVRVRQADGTSRYYRTPPVVPAEPAEFYAALLELKQSWDKFFAAGMRLDVGDRRAFDVARGCIVRAVSGLPGDHPKYGMGSYWGKPEVHDGFPPTTLSLCTCLLDWGLIEEAKRRLGYYLDHFVKPDGILLYYGPAVAEYGQFLDLAVACARQSGDRAWLDRHRGAIERMADYLVRLVDSARKQPAGTLTHGLIQGAAEADTYSDQQFYFSGNAWCVRGLLELGRLDVEIGGVSGSQLAARGRRLIEQAERLRADLARAVEGSVLASQRFLPPVAGQEKAFGTMTESRLASYTNYRYWLEMLSARVLSPAQERMILDYRQTHGGELLATTRFSGHLDDWPYYHHAMGVLAGDRIDRFLLGYWAHVAHHQTQGTFTSYEQVPIRGWRTRGETADYCVPAELTAPLLTRWMLVWPERDAEVLWLGRAAPRAWLAQEVAVDGAGTRWGLVGLRLTPSADRRQFKAEIRLPTGARPLVVLRVRHPARMQLAECRIIGGRCQQLDAPGELVRLRPQADRMSLTLVYRP